MYLQLDLVKKHLNIDDFFKDDDNYLYYLCSVAQDVVQKHIDNNLSDLQNDRGDLPSPIIHAMLLYIGNMYANRESISYSSINKVPFSYDYLLGLYKKY